MFCRKPSVLKTSINIITTTATPTFRTPRSWTSEGEDRGEGDKWSPCRLRVTGCRCDYVGIATGVPQIADDLLHRPSRQSRARSGHPRLVSTPTEGAGPAGRGTEPGGDHRSLGQPSAFRLAQPSDDGRYVRLSCLICRSLEPATLMGLVRVVRPVRS